MKETRPVKIISDLPEKDARVFGFHAYARTIAELAVNKHNKTPLVTGIYGPWGSGKTTLMETIKSFLESNEFDDNQTFRACKTVWFQAWKYVDEKAILADLIEEIFRTIKNDASFMGLSAEQLQKTKQIKGVPDPVVELFHQFVKMGVNDFLAGYCDVTRLGINDAFQAFFDRLVWAYTGLLPAINSTKDPDDEKGALVVFVDDLDRCSWSRIVSVLETINIFMNKKGCIFIIGASEEIIIKALEKDYKQGDAAKFMEKIVQVTFTLPRIQDHDFKAFLKEIDPESRRKIEPHLNLILPITNRNPRRLKRFLNDLYLMEGIHRNKKTGIDFDFLLRMKLIEFEAPDLKDETPDTILLLKSRIKALAVKNRLTHEWEIPGKKIDQVKEVSLKPYLESRNLIDLILKTTLKKEQIQQWISIVDTVKTKATEIAGNRQVKTRKRQKSALGPEAMVTVPEGPFLFGENKESKTIYTPFEIDIYLVTNHRFEAFVNENGYKERCFWTEAGFNWLETETIQMPEYWVNEKWNQPDCPVVGVSWYEADAFCRWLTLTQEDGYDYQLPDEIQWERAASGADGRKYPWGNPFDSEKANTIESGQSATTSVTRYPNGISPAGCYDMAGNVWEWTAGDYGEKMKALRGGSWHNNRHYACCTFRNRDNPGYRYFNIGFRCIRIKKP